MYDKVYGQVGEREVEMPHGTVEVVSFRLVAEINGFCYFATHLMLKQDMDEFPQAYGFILDEMVEFIDRQAGIVS